MQLQFGIVLLYLRHQRVDASLQRAHLRIALLYYRHGDGRLSVGCDYTFAVSRHFLHLAYILYLQQSSFVADVDVLYIADREYLRVEMYGIAIDTVAHAECFQHHIIVADSLFYLRIADAQSCYPHRVGDNGNLRAHHAAVVHHRHLRHLLQAFAYHVAHQSGSLFRLASCHVDVEGRNVQRSYLHHLRAFHILRHGAHRPVYLLIHFDERHAHVRARTE